MAGARTNDSAAWGVVWVFAATAASRLLSLAALAVLARLLAPADFGLLAFALVYVTYVETVGDLGTSMAVIFWPERREDAAQVAFTLSMATAAFWLAVTLLAAPAVAAFFGNEAGAGVLRALAWSFPLKALGSTHDALCQKDLRFRARLVPELGLALGKALLSVALALGGLGVWSLVWGQLCGQALWTALLWRVVPWRPRRRWPRGLLGPMLAYGRGIVAVNVLAAVVHHADLVVVGRMLGATALGLYHVAYKVPEMTITVLTWAVSRVLFPALARRAAQRRGVADAYLAALRYSALLTVPAAVALALLAEPLVRVLFGPQWSAATPLLRALAVYAGLRSLGTQAGDLLKATGRPGLLAAVGGLRALVLVPALVVAARAGAETVALTLVAVTGLTAVINLAVAQRLAGVPVKALAAALRPGLVAGATLGFAMGAWRLLAGPRTSAAALAASLAVGAVAYVLSLRAGGAEVFDSLWRGLGLARGATGQAGRFVVPDAAAALRYFRDSLLVAYTRRERLARRLPLPAAGPLLLRRLTPEGLAASEAVEEALHGLGEPLLRGSPLAGRRLLSIVVGRHASEAERGRLVAFLFADGGERPAAVLKLRRPGFAGPSLRQEFEALGWARGLGPPVAPSVPAPLGFCECRGTEALLLSFIPGRSAYVEMHAASRPRRRVGRHLGAAALWLARFHVATRRAGGVFDVEGERLPLSAGHGDFWARNLLLSDDGSPSVVDWEHFQEQAPPSEDLFHFALTYGLNYPWSRRWRLPPEEAFRLTFIDESPLAHEVRRYCARYCAETGLDPALLRPLLQLYLATRAPRGPVEAAGHEQWLAFHRMLAGAPRPAFAT